MKPAKRIGAFFDRTLGVFFFLSILFLVFILVSVTIEVVGRYFFNKPQDWVIEYSEYALLFIAFLGAAWLLKKRGHVKMDLVINKLGPKTNAVISTITSIIGAVMCFIVTWYGVLVTIDQFQRGIYANTPLETPTAYVLFIIPIGSALLFLQFLRMIFEYVGRWRGGAVSSETEGIEEKELY